MINKYTVDLDNERHPLLVVEESVNYGTKKANGPEEIAKLLNECFSLNKKAEEHLYMVGMSSSNEILGVFEISHGTARESVCGKREIFMRAMLCGAVFFIIVHNHPSGDPKPSREDRNVARALEEAGKMLDIPLGDCIIVGDNNFYSFARENLMLPIGQR